MADIMASWDRPHFAESDGEAFLFYVAFGLSDFQGELNSQKYRCSGIPDGIDVIGLDRVRHSDYIEGFFEGYPWDSLVADDPEFAEAIRRSAGCIVLKGGIRNQTTLDYLRDCIGLLTCLLDHGAIAIYDPQTITWWRPEQWRERIFDPNEPLPSRHVAILSSDDERSPDLTWLHTRGMRKFGRPDICVRGVGPECLEAAADLVARFIEFQAFGAVIPEGQSIRVASLPPGGVVRHGGDQDDLDFNNVHIEIVFPDSALARPAKYKAKKA